jgi:hypothetical protein
VLLVEKKTRVTTIVILGLLFLVLAEAFFVGPTRANPIIVVYNDVSPPDGAQAPLINIYTPLNGSSYPKELALTFDVTFPPISGDGALDAITKIYYKGSWETKETTVAEGSHGSFSIDLSDVRGGNFSVTILAVGEGLVDTGEDYRKENGIVYSYHYFDRFEMTGSSTVSFIKDVVPPMITLLSPQNTTHASSDVELDFTFNEVAEILYCLDGTENQTATGSVILTGLENGAHNVTLYASDLAGNAATPQTLFFNVNAPEPFPTSLVATVVITIAVSEAGLAVYFKKRKH